MSGGGGDAPPLANGGQFILQLLKRPPHHPANPSPQPPPAPSEALPHDPAVAAVGPTIPFSSPTPLPPPPNGHDHVAYNHQQHHHHYPPQLPPWPHHQSLPVGFAPHFFFPQNSNPNLIPNFSTSPPLRPPGFSGVQQLNHQLGLTPLGGDDIKKLGFLGTDPRPSSSRLSDQNLIFGTLHAENSSFSAQLDGNMKEDFAQLGQVEGLYGKGREVGLGNARGFNSLEVEFQNSMSSNHNLRGNVGGSRGNGQERSSGGDGRSGWDKKGHGGSYRAVVAPPPGFTSNSRSGGNKEYDRRRRSFEQNMDKGKTNFVDLNHRNVNLNDKDGSARRFTQRSSHKMGDSLDDRGVGKQLDFPGPPGGITLKSVLASDVEGSMMELHGENDVSGDEFENDGQQKKGKSGSGRQDDLNDLEEQLVDSLGLDDHSSEKTNKVKRRDKDYRSDKRGRWILGQRDRISKRRIECRTDIERLNAPFLAIYESLIPAEEEKAKQKQLLTLLEKLVSKEWPDARLYVYGSCANSFGFSKSDIDICLAIQDTDVNKSEVLLKLAEILQSDNLENVQALTHARVPIVKLMDPITGIACDICINNVLAVINTKLLQDYAKIDSRLRQLAFIVKHWAKSRGVNETYQGTLSSYAYVLMCIHFLQLRKPAILPCLQGMEPTYSVIVDNIKCAYFDQVEKLYGFGSQNGESIAKLVWAFFNYWAYFHDYTNDVISVRTGHILSKRHKDWTRRIGNDRHLICIEDPFETSHDLGRVVDRSSIRVLREEFERAAEIMQCDPDPCVKLFEPYVPS